MRRVRQSPHPLTRTAHRERPRLAQGSEEAGANSPVPGDQRTRPPTNLGAGGEPRHHPMSANSDPPASGVGKRRAFASHMPSALRRGKAEGVRLGANCGDPPIPQKPKDAKGRNRLTGQRVHAIARKGREPVTAQESGTPPPPHPVRAGKGVPPVLGDQRTWREQPTSRDRHRAMT
jgi:hypothetical protein